LTRPIPGDAPRLIDFSPDGKRFAVDEQTNVAIVDIASGQVVVTLVGHRNSGKAVKY
jgi:DNA-binding beta-propeller fold protein YncE